jgi:hypothetical protein
MTPAAHLPGQPVARLRQCFGRAATIATPTPTTHRPARSHQRPRIIHTQQRAVFHSASSTAICNIAVTTLIQCP